MKGKTIHRIMRAAEYAPHPGSNRSALIMEMESFLNILKVLMDERKRIEESMRKEMDSRNPVIMSIPGIGPIHGSIILGKIGDISRF